MLESIVLVFLVQCDGCVFLLVQVHESVEQHTARWLRTAQSSMTTRGSHTVGGSVQYRKQGAVKNARSAIKDEISLTLFLLACKW